MDCNCTHRCNCHSPGPMVLYPSFIPSVLNKILGYLPHSDLKNFRNVSSQWAEEGWKIMRKNSVMEIQVSNLERLEEIHSYFLTKKSDICRGIKIQDFQWTLVCSPIFIQFASEYGNLIKHIHLEESTYNSNAHVHQSKLFGLFPNLEELILSFQEPDLTSFNSATRDTATNAGDSDENVPFKLDKLKSLTLNRIFRKEDGCFVMKILKSAPCVTTISISKRLLAHSDVLKTLPGFYNASPPRDLFNQDDNFMNRQARPFHAVRKLLGCGNILTYNELFSHYFLTEKNLVLKNILHLDFHMLITSDVQLYALRSRQCVALKTLHLVLGSNLDNNEIRTLLTSFSGTLERLYLSLNTTTSADFSQESRYHQIWDMSVEWKKLNLLCIRNIQCFSIPLTDNMPHLRTLLIHGCNFPNLMMKDCEKEEAEICVREEHREEQNKLQNLVVHCDKSKRLTTQVLMSVYCRFPNLKKLKLENLTDIGLRVIFSNLSLLEDLYLASDSISDSGITGLRAEVCRKLLKTQGNNKRSFSSLQDLRRLHKLELASSNISDVSILYGVAECQTLRKLFLYSPKISSKSVRKIVGDMQLSHLEIEFCQQLSDAVVQYAKKTFVNPANVGINKQGLKSSVQIKQYFEARGATFHLRD